MTAVDSIPPILDNLIINKWTCDVCKCTLLQSSRAKHLQSMRHRKNNIQMCIKMSNPYDQVVTNHILDNIGKYLNASYIQILALTNKKHNEIIRDKDTCLNKTLKLSIDLFCLFRNIIKHGSYYKFSDKDYDTIIKVNDIQLNNVIEGVDNISIPSSTMRFIFHSRYDYYYLTFILIMKKYTYGMINDVLMLDTTHKSIIVYMLNVLKHYKYMNSRKHNRANRLKDYFYG